MIKASFKTKKDLPVGISLKGHANFADLGSDIVCAAVSSNIQLVVNGITEILGVNAEVKTGYNIIEIMLPENAPDCALSFLKALMLNFENLENDYPENIKVTITEV